MTACAGGDDARNGAATAGSGAPGPFRRSKGEVSAGILDIDCVAPMGIIRILHRSTVAARPAAQAYRSRCRRPACDNRGASVRRPDARAAAAAESWTHATFRD